MGESGYLVDGKILPLVIGAIGHGQDGAREDVSEMCKLPSVE